MAKMARIKNKDIKIWQRECIDGAYCIGRVTPDFLFS